MEIDCELLLIDWFTANKIRSYTNRNSNALHYHAKFTVKGTLRKPDMVIYTKNLGYIAIEIKPADMSRSVGDGSKIIDYWQDYIEKKAQYYIENKKIDISYFIMATGYSIDGHLFTQEYGFKLQDYPRHPKKEFLRTKDYMRKVLFDTFRRYKNRKLLISNQPGWGVLLSTTLNGDTKKKPAIFYQRFLFNNIKKSSEMFTNFEEVY